MDKQCGQARLTVRWTEVHLAPDFLVVTTLPSSSPLYLTGFFDCRAHSAIFWS